MPSSAQPRPTKYSSRTRPGVVVPMGCRMQDGLSRKPIPCGTTVPVATLSAARRPPGAGRRRRAPGRSRLGRRAGGRRGHATSSTRVPCRTSRRPSGFSPWLGLCGVTNPSKPGSWSPTRHGPGWSSVSGLSRAPRVVASTTQGAPSWPARHLAYRPVLAGVSARASRSARRQGRRIAAPPGQPAGSADLTRWRRGSRRA